MPTASDTSDRVYRELFAAAPDAIIVVAADGTVLLANDECTRLFGYSHSELVGMQVEELVPVEARYRHREHRGGYVQHPRGRPMGSGLDLSGQRKDGTRIPVEISLSPVSRGGAGDPLVLAIVRDVSDRRATDQQIRDLSDSLQSRVAHLEALNSELETFTYSVSHDLRAPLRAVDGFSAALLQDYAADLPAEAQHYVDRVRAGAQRMNQLIDDLLALSRISRSELHLEEVDVSGLAGVVLQELTSADPERRVESEIERDVRLRADPRQLRVVLENLLGNSWKFSAKRPRTHIAVGGTTLDGEPAVVVSDNGAGFDEQYAARMFWPFQRLHPTDEFPGTGVGLAIVQRILLRHGGRITAGSHPGAGATFVFRTTPSPAAPVDGQTVSEAVVAGGRR